MTENYDLVVIGGGSGGLAAAQRAAEYGAKVVLAESGRLGGTCVNVGCVPKKIMWNAAELGSVFHDARDYGFDVEARGLDWASLKAKRDAYIERLNGIYAANLAKRSVELVRARASFVDAHTVSAGGDVDVLGAQQPATGAHGVGIHETGARAHQLDAALGEVGGIIAVESLDVGIALGFQ